MEMMSQMGLQPEPDQEKRMQKACIDPLWSLERSRAGGEETGGEGRGVADLLRERDGSDESDESDGQGGEGEADFWRERDGE